tara:strand:- start:229 stop:1017 length:789 start_codon:yes stop_codon:yes gene_type:complete
MIDFHNHVLPKIDDGSKSMDMSIDMLREAHQQGIKEIVNTVHYQHPKVEGLKITYGSIKEKTSLLQNELDKNNIPIRIHIGSEVFFLPNLMKIKDDPLATIGNGKYMLIEFQPHFIPDNHKQIFFELKMDGITPIIAHPERYKPVQEDIGLVYNWLNTGCLIQVDAGSITGTLGESAFNAAQDIIKNNWCQILGSDAHNNGRRNFILKDAYLKVENWIGDAARPLVFENPRSVLNGESITLQIEENQIERKSSFWKKIKLIK